MKKYVELKYPKYNIFVIAYYCGGRNHTSCVGRKALAFYEQENHLMAAFDFYVMLT
jgi:hypothetical protein